MSPTSPHLKMQANPAPWFWTSLPVQAWQPQREGSHLSGPVAKADMETVLHAHLDCSLDEDRHRDNEFHEY